MLTPVCCMTCGYPIGDKSVIYNYIKHIRTKSALKQQNIHSSHAENSGVNMNDVLKALNINMDCCRGCITTSMDFRDYYR